jgi:N-methylhydantoinase A
MLAAFGGAGPLHSALLARDLKIPKVLAPLYPGLNSAMGMLQTSVRHVYLQSSVARLSEITPQRMNEIFAGLEARAKEDVTEEGFVPDQVSIGRQVDMRYQHQGYQLPVACPVGDLTEAGKPALKAGFDDAHLRVYGASAPDEDAEVVTFRVIAEIAVPRLELRMLAEGGDASGAQIATRRLYDLETACFMDAAIYDRGKLLAGDQFEGPAVVQQFDSTTVILAGMSCRVDPWGNLIIETGDAS